MPEQPVSHVPESVQVPLLSMLQEIAKSIHELKSEVQRSHDALSARLKIVEDWQLRHEVGDGHPKVTTTLDKLSERLGKLQEESDAAAVREQDRSKREGRRMAWLTVGGGLGLLLLTGVGLVLPYVLHVGH